MLEIIQLAVLEDNYIYVLHDRQSQATAVVDPALARPVLDTLSANNWQLDYIFNTHQHWDHVGGNLELKQKTACKIIASVHDQQRIPGIDITVAEGDKLALGTRQISIIETPGHTNGHIVYYFADDQALFCGDTLFAMGCGRLFEGTAGQMWQSLQKLKQLPETTRIYCAHEYTQHNARFALSVEPGNIVLQQRIKDVDQLRAKNLPTIPTQLKIELQTNPFLRGDSRNLQETITMSGKSPLEIFTKTRQLKDRY